MTEKQRTLKQSRSIHKWFEEIARECMHNGTTIKIILDNLNEGVYPDEDTIKLLFKEVSKSMFGKDKTSKLTTYELTKVSEQFEIIMAKSGVDIPFPSMENTDEYLKSYDNYM